MTRRAIASPMMGRSTRTITLTNQPVGTLTGVSDLGGGTASYGYDGLYRLTGETRTGTGANSHSYTYDPAGNRLTYDGQVYTYDNANKPTGGHPDGRVRPGRRHG